MRIAYIGDFINHGDIFINSGTPIVFILARHQEVEEVSVYCPYENKKTESVKVLVNIRVTKKYRCGDF